MSMTRMRDENIRKALSAAGKTARQQLRLAPYPIAQLLSELLVHRMMRTAAYTLNTLNRRISLEGEPAKGMDTSVLQGMRGRGEASTATTSNSAKPQKPNMLHQRALASSCHRKRCAASPHSRDRQHPVSTRSALVVPDAVGTEEDQREGSWRGVSGQEAERAMNGR